MDFFEGLFMKFTILFKIISFPVSYCPFTPRPPPSPPPPTLNAFFDCFFFQKFACGAENFAEIGAKQCFGRAQKINLFDLKKRSSKFSISF